jgi:hypothetical protein
VTWRLALPVDRANEPLTIRKALELSAYVTDADDRVVTRELMLLMHEIGERVGGQLGLGDWSEILEKDLSPAQRKGLISRMRRRAGLESVEEIEAAEHYTSVQRNALARAANDTRPMRLVYSPSGAIIDANDAEDEAARQRAAAASLAAQRQAEQAQRDVEAEARRQHEAAQAERLRAELPDHLKDAA